MSSFKVRLFGEFSATDHRGNTLALGSRRTAATIAWLAMHLDAPAPLRDFAALFGGDGAGALGRDLRYALRFASPDVLIGSGDTLRFNPRSVEVDVVRFDILAANGSLNAIRAAAEMMWPASMIGYPIAGSSTGTPRWPYSASFWPRRSKRVGGRTPPTPRAVFSRSIQHRRSCIGP
jgi:hypothetical protein